jgi:hypothetical protein
MASCAEPVVAPAAPIAHEEPSTACGALWEGKVTPCPLQLWMRDHVSASLSDDDYPTLADALTTASKFSPDPEWEWEAIAIAGANAARRADLPEIKQACRTCHLRYRAIYKERYRPRPPPWANSSTLAP